MQENQQALVKHNYRYRLIIGSVLFFIFFIYYMGVAVINTPEFKDTAAIVVVGMPLGMFLTLLIFPVSWLLVTIYFLIWR